jgi:hypothetical protein
MFQSAFIGPSNKVLFPFHGAEGLAPPSFGIPLQQLEMLDCSPLTLTLTLTLTTDTDTDH